MAVQEPKYQKVIDWITGEIASGNLKPGDRLMPEEKMSKKFDLCRQTIRRATQELVERGIVVRVQGSGTYVGGMIPKTSKNRYMNVAVMSTFYENYIFPPIFRGIEKILSRSGYAMQVSFTNNRVSNETAILNMLLERNNIDGLIAEPSKGALPNPNIKYYKEILDRHIPILFFNDMYPDVPAPCVRIDDWAFASNAAKLLIDAGHNKIGGIFKLDDGQGHRRYDGFLSAVLKANVHISSRQIFWIDTETQAELKVQEEYLFQRLEGCTGVVCYNDQVAKQVVDMAINRGLRVPEDLSVVSIDDSELATICQVPFTSFPHPKEKLGEKAAENLLKMIENPAFDGNYIFSAEPVFRNSIQKL